MCLRTGTEGGQDPLAEALTSKNGSMPPSVEQGRLSTSSSLLPPPIPSQQKQQQQPQQKQQQQQQQQQKQQQEQKQPPEPPSPVIRTPGSAAGQAAAAQPPPHTIEPALKGSAPTPRRCSWSVGGKPDVVQTQGRPPSQAGRQQPQAKQSSKDGRVSDTQRNPSTVPTHPRQLRPQTGPGGSTTNTGSGAVVRTPARPTPQPGLALRPQPGPTAARRTFEEPLDPRFKLVEKPKRFFTVGRIFKTVWFEPGGTELANLSPLVGSATNQQQQQQQQLSRRQDIDYAQACPAFHSEKPHAKFRWFVVVRRRLHHSLCFPITTSSGRPGGGGGAGGNGGPKQSGKGRPRDYVVLYTAPVTGPAAASLASSGAVAAAAAAAAATTATTATAANVASGGDGVGAGAAATSPSPSSTPAPTTSVPPEPLEGEGIEREPLGVIIEDGAQTISKFARLDCGRVYTVEDTVKVMKIGRIHADWLRLLDQYYKESVA